MVTAWSLFGSEESVTFLSENDVKSDTYRVLIQIACVFNFIVLAGVWHF